MHPLRSSSKQLLVFCLLRRSHVLFFTSLPHIGTFFFHRAWRKKCLGERWLGMVLGSHQDPTFSVFSDLSLFFGALLLTAFLFSKVASSWHTKIGCHVASGVAIWAVLGQIGATWYILGYLTLTTLVIDAFRVTLVAAVVLVVVSDMQTYIKLRSQQAPSPAAGVHSSTRP